MLIMNKDVYLFEFDISHSGQKILFKKEKIFDFFKAYLLISDHIYLQASAPMKIKEVYDLFLKYQFCFKYNNIDKIPLVSLVLSKDIDSYEEYLDQRLDKLSNAHINPKKNFEYSAYTVNNADKIVTSLDQKIIYENSGYYFKRREDSADKLFRRNVKLLFQQEKIIEKYHINTKQQKELLNYPKNMELFQTFELGKLIKNNLRIHNHQSITEEIRKMYYKANQEAVHANSSKIDEHFDFEIITTFYKLINIDNYIKKLDSCEKIFELRKNPHFIYLKNIYFELLSKESLSTLKESFELGARYKFIDLSYDFLVPFILELTLKGIEVLIGSYSKDIAKDILQNIIGRWLSTIPEFSEYKIHQEIRSLKKSLL